MSRLTATLKDPLIVDAAMRRRVDRVLASLGQGFNAYLERLARTDQINRLNAMTDAELARIGLTRQDIPFHVFRDLMHI